MNKDAFLLSLGWLALTPASFNAAPLSTAFSYQGTLTESGAPATGVYDLRFTLFNLDTGGSVVGGPLTAAATAVSNGSFTVVLDFGASVFMGDARWLDISIRTNGSPNPHAALVPRQSITPTPYALHAVNAANLMSFANTPLDIKVNGLRGLRLEDNRDSGSDEGTVPDGAPNLIGGSPSNFVGVGIVGATIGGGGATNYNSFGYVNAVQSDFGVVGGGLGNLIATHSRWATISGGRLNVIATDSEGSAIGGGEFHQIMGSGDCTIGGGSYNCLQNSLFSSIAGGTDNCIVLASEAVIAGGTINWIAGGAMNSIGGGRFNFIIDSTSAIIAGGEANSISNSLVANVAGGFGSGIGPNANFGTIGGGYGNLIRNGAEYGTIHGGRDNTIEPRGSYATIPGGRNNTATNSAFAVGTRAKAHHTGAFVWGDSTDADIASTNNNSMTFRASGGMRIFSDSNALAGVFLAPGSGSWTAMSDRRAKENVQSVDSRQVLEKVAALPLATWNYKTQPASVRHLGPMAQDFKAAFDLGESDTGINTVDASGVALAAIQGLNHKLEEQMKEKNARISALERKLDALQKMLLAVQHKQPRTTLTSSNFCVLCPRLRLQIASEATPNKVLLH